MKPVQIIACATLLFACTDEQNSVRTLEASGFTEIHLTGYSWFECGEHDAFHTGFTAKNVNGKTVSGTVCCGFLAKGCTVRW